MKKILVTHLKGSNADAGPPDIRSCPGCPSCSEPKDKTPKKMTECIFCGEKNDWDAVGYNDHLARFCPPYKAL